MANTLLPIEERNLTPDQVEQLDKRRRRGQLFLVLCLQTFIIGTLVTFGQDRTGRCRRAGRIRWCTGM